MPDTSDHLYLINLFRKDKKFMTTAQKKIPNNFFTTLKIANFAFITKN